MTKIKSSNLRITALSQCTTGILKKMATAFPCTLLLSDKTKEKNKKFKSSNNSALAMYNGYLKKDGYCLSLYSVTVRQNWRKKIRLKLKINFQKTYVPKTIGKNSEFRNKLAILLMKCIKSVNQNKKVTKNKKNCSINWKCSL